MGGYFGKNLLYEKSVTSNTHEMCPKDHRRWKTGPTLKPDTDPDFRFSSFGIRRRHRKIFHDLILPSRQHFRQPSNQFGKQNNQHQYDKLNNDEWYDPAVEVTGGYFFWDNAFEVKQ